jgi:hypothetical protein
MATQIDLGTLTHNHVFLGVAHDENARRTLCVVALTALMMVGEIVAVGLSVNIVSAFLLWGATRTTMAFRMATITTVMRMTFVITD